MIGNVYFSMKIQISILLSFHQNLFFYCQDLRYTKLSLRFSRILEVSSITTEMWITHSNLKKIFNVFFDLLHNAIFLWRQCRSKWDILNDLRILCVLTVNISCFLRAVISVFFCKNVIYLGLKDKTASKNHQNYIQINARSNPEWWLESVPFPHFRTGKVGF